MSVPKQKNYYSPWIPTVILAIFALMVSAMVDRIRQDINNLEGRIALHEGKAQLLTDDMCIISNEGLKNEELAKDLARACVQSYKLKEDSTK